MSFFGPSFAGIQSGWYRTTEGDNYAIERAKIDKVWNNLCDKIIIYYVKKYGTFFTAFDDSIIKDIDNELGTNLQRTTRYYCYYISNRAFELDAARHEWVSSHDIENKKQTKIKCNLCHSSQLLLDCHPDLIRDFGIPPKYCRSCSYMVKRFSYFTTDIQNRLRVLMKNLNKIWKCDLCNKKYSLQYSIIPFSEYVDYIEFLSIVV